MDLPLIGGKGIGQHLVEKCIEQNQSEESIFMDLTRNYATHSYFRKENTIAALCALYSKVTELSLKDSIIKFLKSINESELPLLNKAECTIVRIKRKLLVVNIYSQLREEIKQELNVMPEKIRHINPPTVLSETYPDELISHWVAYKYVASKTDMELEILHKKLLKIEKKIDGQYEVSKLSIGSDEREFCGGFEITGLYYKDSFSNIMLNLLGKDFTLVDEEYIYENMWYDIQESPH